MRTDGWWREEGRGNERSSWRKRRGRGDLKSKEKRKEEGRCSKERRGERRIEAVRRGGEGQ